MGEEEREVYRRADAEAYAKFKNTPAGQAEAARAALPENRAREAAY